MQKPRLLTVCSLPLLRALQSSARHLRALFPYLLGLHRALSLHEPDEGVEAVPTFLSTEEANQAAHLVLTAAGASEEVSAIVAEHLVTSELQGLASHGLLRLPQYVAESESGELDPSRWPTLDVLSPTRANIDGKRCFGQVAGMVASEWATKAASSAGVCVVTARDIGHTGRIGAYVESLARSGAAAVAFSSGPPSGQRVAPFGAVEGRLSTNPIAYAFPTETDPVVADFSTSVVPEGKARAALQRGEPVVAGALQDADGAPSTEPQVLYERPPGTLLPLGGPMVGYKGTALALLVELMATILAGDRVTDSTRIGNNLCLVGISLPDGARAAASELVGYVKSARPSPGGQAVLVPGEREQLHAAQAKGVSVPGATWSAIKEVAARYGVERQLDDLASRHS